MSVLDNYVKTIMQREGKAVAIIKQGLIIYRRIYYHQRKFKDFVQKNQLQTAFTALFEPYLHYTAL